MTYQDDLTASLSLSLDWPTTCVPLFSVRLLVDEEEVTHSRLVPTVAGSGGDRQLRLALPLEGLPENTLYEAQLTSISDGREVTVVDPIPYSKCIYMCVVYIHAVLSHNTGRIGWSNVGSSGLG